MRTLIVFVCLLTACSSRGVRCDARLQPINPATPPTVTDSRSDGAAP